MVFDDEAGVVTSGHYGIPCAEHDDLRSFHVLQVLVPVRSLSKNRCGLSRHEFRLKEIWTASYVGAKIVQIRKNFS